MMTKKYNLALTPLSKSNEAITIARKLSNIADEYLLGENSLPHVTLYQFQAQEKEIKQIWWEVCDSLEEKQIDLMFNNFSCITFDNKVFWVSLLPNNRDFLHKLHGLIANVLRLPIKKTFDPHMTLISTTEKEYEKKVALVSDFYKPITDTFILSLGISDDIGQLKQILT